MSSSLLALREDPGPGRRQAAKAGAGAPPPQASGEPPPPAGSWKREMERAQLDSWFKPGQTAASAQARPAGVDGRDALSPGMPRLAPPGDAMKADARTAAPGFTAGMAANRAPVMPASAAAAAHPPRFEAGRMAAADIRLGALALALARVSRLKVAGLAPGSEDFAEVPADALHAAVAPGEASGPDRAIRLHAEWQGQDVTVWLGLDSRAGVPQDQLAQLLPHIRACLQAQRSRLARLVCNGTTVFEVSSPFLPVFPYVTQPKESP